MSNSSLKDKITLTTAVVGLVTAVVGVVNGAFATKKTDANAEALKLTQASLTATQSEVEALRDCRGKVAARINSPLSDNGRAISASGDILVAGESSIHDACYFVVLLSHDLTAVGAPWTVEDSVQVNTNGQWSGRVRMLNVPLGDVAQIDARVVAQPSLYLVNQTLPFPPETGVRTNSIQVRRVQ